MDNKKRIRFISNPISGTKDKELIYKNIESLLNTDLYTYEICETEYAGHAAELAKAAVKDGIEIVVAIGGDSPGGVADMPGHVTRRHCFRGSLGARHDVRVHGQGAESVRGPLSVDQIDEVIGRD